MAFLRKNVDNFAWNAYDALGVDLDFICHHLNVNPMVIPRKQSPRGSSKEHAEAVKEEEEEVSWKCFIQNGWPIQLW